LLFCVVPGRPENAVESRVPASEESGPGLWPAVDGAGADGRVRVADGDQTTSIVDGGLGAML
jgi:hypothetical protein